MTWLLDPQTREPLPASDADVRYMAKRAEGYHWRPGWRSGFHYEGGYPVRMWFAQCSDPCCVEFWANQPPIEDLVTQTRAT